MVLVRSSRGGFIYPSVVTDTNKNNRTILQLVLVGVIFYFLMKSMLVYYIKSNRNYCNTTFETIIDKDFSEFEVLLIFGFYFTFTFLTKEFLRMLTGIKFGSYTDVFMCVVMIICFTCMLPSNAKYLLEICSNPNFGLGF